ERDELWDLVGVDGRRGHVDAMHLLDLGRDAIALRDRATRQGDVAEGVGIHRALVGDDAADAAGADDQDLAHAGWTFVGMGKRGRWLRAGAKVRTGESRCQGAGGLCRVTRSLLLGSGRPEAVRLGSAVERARRGWARWARWARRDRRAPGERAGGG